MNLREIMDAHLWYSARKHMLKGDSELQAMPEMIAEIERKIIAHDKWVDEALRLGAFSGIWELDGDDVPEAVAEVDTSLSAIWEDVKRVRDAFTLVSRNIDVYQYDVKADCCPTVVNTLRHYWLP